MFTHSSTNLFGNEKTFKQTITHLIESLTSKLNNDWLQNSTLFFNESKCAFPILRRYLSEYGNISEYNCLRVYRWVF